MVIESVAVLIGGEPGKEDILRTRRFFGRFENFLISVTGAADDYKFPACSAQCDSLKAVKGLYYQFYVLPLFYGTDNNLLIGTISRFTDSESVKISSARCTVFRMVSRL